MFIPKPTIDAILELPIEKVIGEYVKLRHSGSNYTGLCPFHNENTPSFSVSPSKRIYKCFGCSKGGSVIQFVMDKESITYPEAAKLIATKWNIPVEAYEGNITKKPVAAGDEVKDFDFITTPLNEQSLKPIISRQVMESVEIEKIASVCKEYGLQACNEFTFLKDTDGTREQVTIKSTPANPVYLFDLE